LSYLLDTNTCIRYLNGQSENVKKRLERLRPDDVLLCSVVKAEFVYGAAKSNVGERTRARLNQFVYGAAKSNVGERTRARLNQFCGTFNSLPFDDRSATMYGAIRADLERRGTPIGPNDLMVAAIALASGSILVTHNTREFGRVGDLKLEDWE
jgi:tRNA(fMet)-specific endonuclease VapC